MTGGNRTVNSAMFDRFICYIFAPFLFHVHSAVVQGCQQCSVHFSKACMYVLRDTFATVFRTRGFQSSCYKTIIVLVTAPDIGRHTVFHLRFQFYAQIDWQVHQLCLFSTSTKGVFVTLQPTWIPSNKCIINISIFHSSFFSIHFFFHSQIFVFCFRFESVIVFQ